MEQVRVLQGGLNTDDSVELMSPDDWSFAVNIVSGRAYLAKNGEKENVRGTAALSSGVDLSGCVFVGGVRAAEDDVSYLCFYHETPANQCIVKFDKGTVSLVLRWDGLNFSPLKEHRVNGGGIAGSLLYITDNNNEPRCIHTTRYSDGSTPDSEEEILHIKRGPTYAPEVDFSGLTGINNKPIDDVQFAYQYVYTDGQYSVISPWTTLIRGFGMEGITGAIHQVSLRINALESIPVLVDRILLVARKGNDGVPFYWQEIQKSQFEQTTYPYIYTEQSIGVVPSMYLKAFDLVPLKAGSSCVTKSRAWFANYLEGYNTPKLNFVGAPTVIASLIDSTVSDAGPTCSPNARFRLGIVFHDEQGRSCGVLDRGWELETPFEVAEQATRTHIQYRIQGSGLLNIPFWAKYYSLVMTKDLVKSYFIQSSSFANTANLPYVHISSDGTESGSTTYDPLNHEFLKISQAEANLSNIFYSYNDGDYVVVTNLTDGVTKGPLKVRRTDSHYIYCDAADMGNSGNFELAFQVYSPRDEEDQIYYEIHRRPVQYDGDGIPYLDTTDYTIDGDCVNVQVNGDHTQQMRHRPNDGPWNTDIGKPYIVTHIGQVQKSHFIRFSSPFIAGINVNGLSEFQSGDEDNVPVEATKVQKLMPTTRENSDGEVILAICNTDTFSVYVDEARMSTNDGQSLVISSLDVIGDVRKQRSGFGTLHPESVIEEGGEVFWYDHLARSYVRYSTNGIFPISEYKAVNYFEEQATLNSKDDIVVSGFDGFYKMVTVTFINASTNSKKTIAFSTGLNRWISFMDFAPEGYVIGSNKLYSVKSGVIYSHDDSSNFNRFYGVDYDSKISVSFNDDMGLPKEWRVFQAQVSPNFFEWSDGNQVVKADAMRVDLSNRQGQETSILDSEIDVDEYLAYGVIRGDENTGTVLTGDPIYSNTLQATLTFSGGTYKQVTMLKAGCEISRGHNL